MIDRTLIPVVSRAMHDRGKELAGRLGGVPIHPAMFEDLIAEAAITAYESALAEAGFEIVGTE